MQVEGGGKVGKSGGHRPDRHRITRPRGEGIEQGTGESAVHWAGRTGVPFLSLSSLFAPSDFLMAWGHFPNQANPKHVSISR